jgi:hypothetical protein
MLILAVRTPCTLCFLILITRRLSPSDLQSEAHSSVEEVESSDETMSTEEDSSGEDDTRRVPRTKRALGSAVKRTTPSSGKREAATSSRRGTRVPVFSDVDSGGNDGTTPSRRTDQASSSRAQNSSHQKRQRKASAKSSTYSSGKRDAATSPEDMFLGNERRLQKAIAYELSETFIRIV